MAQDRRRLLGLAALAARRRRLGLLLAAARGDLLGLGLRGLLRRGGRARAALGLGLRPALLPALRRLGRLGLGRLGDDLAEAGRLADAVAQVEELRAARLARATDLHVHHDGAVDRE